MPRHPDTPQLLLDAAIALFAERTYEGTQMPAVAARAGVGVGSIYRYFPSKEALGNAAFQDAKRDLLDHLAEATAGPADSIRAEFGQFWAGFTGFAGSRSAAFAFLEHQQHDTFLDQESRTLAAELDQLAADFIERGQQAGAIRDGEPQFLVALALGAFAGLLRAIRPAAVTDLPQAERDRAEQAVWSLLSASPLSSKDS
ncbi:TetR/AcrR family transcriptional regulator [Kitasatospora sp. NBC_01287]|uniref:TetR/AcrR family transcriptional regulator n=1 Tax=Kitasatospora sp. NBC_01287 TaxID=2903573 RepID=UPI002252E6E0|nr:TetR/AcrR family transcriptional regulator [Kitasatospora sp. NBC_01287]MCX4749095.1 TetR/AcrR family transcriptional regulator [Kitasatospora sp. NBC_01287]